MSLKEMNPQEYKGSCLLPQADESIMRKCLENENEMNARIFTFPSSLLKINDRKINYYDYLHCSSSHDGLKQALNSLTPSIMQLDFERLIDSTPFLSPLQRDFYLQYLCRRREILF